MLNITCTFCRAPINLSDGDLALLMQEVSAKRPKSVPVPCPACRRANKVPTQRLQQAYRLAGSPPVPEPAPVEVPAAGDQAPPVQ